MAYNPLTDFQAAMQRAQGNTGYENYGREFFDPVSGMNFSRGWGGMNQDFARLAGDQGGGGTMTLAMSGVGQDDIWRAYDGAAGREAKDNFALNGSPYQMYGQDGNYTGQGTWEGLDENTIMEQLIPLGMMAAPFALTMMGAGGAAGAAGAAGGSGAAGASGAATASELAGAGLGFGGGGTSLGAGAYGSLGAIAPEAMAAAMGMSPEAFAALGAGGLGAAGASGGMLAGTSAASGGGGSWLSNLLGGGGSTAASVAGGGSKLLGLGATALGGLLGAKGNEASASSTKSMDPRMDALFYGDLAPKTASTMAGQMPAANTAGNQMLSVGGGLLGQTAPTTATNPYLKSIADDMSRRTEEMLAKNNLAIQGNAVGVGGLGGSRQGVAQGVAAGQAADSLQGQIAGLYGNAYNQDQNRLRQDWTIGAGLQSQGLNTQFQPLRNAADVYTPFTGYGTTTQSQQSGGGAMGAVGGALGAAQLGKNMGWW